MTSCDSLYCIPYLPHALTAEADKGSPSNALKACQNTGLYR